MRTRIAIATAAAAAAATVLAGASVAQAREPSVEIKDAVARVTVVPSDRTDIKVVFKSTNARLPLRIEKRGAKTFIIGDLKRRIRNCRGGFDKASVTVRDVGEVRWDQMPEVIIYTPRDANVGASGAVFGYIGRASSVDFSNAGCGDWTIANVAGGLDISQAGSGDVYAGSVGSLDLSVAGSGDTKLKAVGGKADISIAGSGDVVMTSINGDLDVSIAGSGDVKVYGGNAGNVDVSVAGSGDIRLAGVANSVDATFMGSGDLWVTRVNGKVSKTVMGSGGVHVGPFKMNDN
jgi:hypothetical protein